MVDRSLTGRLDLTRMVDCSLTGCLDLSFVAENALAYHDSLQQPPRYLGQVTTITGYGWGSSRSRHGFAFCLQLVVTWHWMP